MRARFRSARRLNRLVKAAPRLRRMRIRDIPTMLHASILIAFVEVCVRRYPPAKVGRLLGCPIDTTPVDPQAARMRNSDLPSHTVRQLRCARRVAEVWPFSEGPCLRSALVGGRLIRRHAPVVRIGIDPSSDELAAHAWLEIDGRPLEAVHHYLAFQERDSSERSGRTRGRDVSA